AKARHAGLQPARSEQRQQECDTKYQANESMETGVPGVALKQSNLTAQTTTTSLQRPQRAAVHFRQCLCSHPRLNQRLDSLEESSRLSVRVLDANSTGLKQAAVNGAIGILLNQ